MKKILAVILSIVVLCASLPMLAVGVMAEQTDGIPTFSASEAYGFAGDTVTVDVSAYGNPGIISLKLDIDYDTSALELISYEEVTFEGLTTGSIADSPFVLNWLDDTFVDNVNDGNIASLTFKIKDEAVAGLYPVVITYDQADVYNSAYEDVYFDVQDGSVEVYPCEHLNTETATTEYVDATCTDDGYYTIVTYCTDCGEELSGDGDIIEATGHNVDENNVCLNCGELITYPAFVVSHGEGKIGETVTVTVSTINNPGIISSKLDIGYDDEVLVLESVEEADFADLTYGPTDNNPFVINWADGLGSNNTTDGVLAVLNFVIKDSAPEGVSDITVSYDPDDVFDYDLNNVYFETQNGSVEVYGCQHETQMAVEKERFDGTCVEDGYVVTAYVCGLCGLEISSETTYTEATGHKFTVQEEISATCTTTGRMAYLYCTGCKGDYAFDADIYTPLNQTISYNELIIPYTHSVNDNGICSICGEVVYEYPTFVVSDASGRAGDTVTVDISIKNNPGIVSFRLDIGYDADKFELTGCSAGVFSKASFGDMSQEPFVINWVDTLGGNNDANGTIATLTFKINEGVDVGENIISINYSPDDIYDENYDNVSFDVYDGLITVLACEHENTEIVTEEYVDATCTEDGYYTIVTYCTDCGEAIAGDGDIIEATGHSIDENSICKNCGEFITVPSFVVSSARGKVGNTVTVTVSTVNNSGIISMLLQLGYDSNALKVQSVDGADFANVAFGPTDANPIAINWVDGLNPDNTTDGTVAIITFKVKEDALEGIYPITLTYAQEDVFDENLEDVYFNVQNGSVEVYYCDHTQTTTVTENWFAGDCVTNGSYDKVVYCDECGNELSRTAVTVDAEGHSFVNVDEAPADCTNLGTVAHKKCIVCDHSFAADADIFIDFEQALTSEQLTIPYSHEANADGKCALCGSYVFTEPTFVVSSTQGYAGSQIAIKISIVNNPGIISFKLKIAYDGDVLEFVDSNGEGVYANNMAFGPSTLNPFVVNWVDTLDGNYTDNGDCVTLVFKIKDGAQLGNYPFTITYVADDVFNYNYENVYFDIHNGTVEIVACPHTQTTVKNENVVNATCTTDGKYDEVAYCLDCGNEVSREEVIVEATGHASAATKENEKAATCTEAGSYDSVVKCTVCDEELSRETITVKATGHTEASAVEENYKAPSCEDDGSYDSVVYCTVCGKELSRETVIVDALGHTEASAVEENYKAPTCVEKGSYDSVVYCAVCKKELSRKTIEIDTIPHTTGDAITENVKSPSCEYKGSYDSVKYCTVCSNEVSRETTYTAYGHKIGANGECTECKAEIAQPIFYVTGGTALKGDTFTVSVAVKNNPGIVSMRLLVDYDASVFELIDATGGEFTSVAFGPSDNQPFVINWIDTINPNNTTDGIIAILTFNVKEDTNAEETMITIGYDADDVYDSNYENVAFEKNYTVVEVADYTIGDVNNDGKINNKDLGILMQYLNGWDVEIYIEAADVNDDSKVNNKDYGLLMQYCNGWEVELKQDKIQKIYKNQDFLQKKS